MTRAIHEAGSPDDLLASQALLFASGLLHDEEADAFEVRLSEDQTAREALCQAVQLLQGRGAALRPDPAYRRRVLQRLRRARGLLGWLLRERSSRVSPAVWGGLGAATAALLLLGVFWSWPANAPQAPPLADNTVQQGQE